MKDRKHLHIDDASSFGRMDTESTRPKTFWDYCKEDPASRALIEIDGRTWSRGTLGAASVAIRNDLASAGCSGDAAVAIVAPNCAEFVIAYLGITMLGATAVPVNYHLTADELVHVIRTSSVTTIIVHHTLREKIVRILNGLGDAAPRLISMVEPADAGIARDADVMAVAPLPLCLGQPMVFTSATTGRPKAVKSMPDHGYVGLERRISFRESQGTYRNSGSVHFCASMLYHVGPLEGAVVTLHMGNTLVIMRRWDVRSALKAIGDYRVTEAFLVPIMVVQLAKIPMAERDQYDLSSLRMLIHAGAPCPVEAKQKLIEWVGPIVYEGYGASEGGGTFVSTTEWQRFPGTVGRPIPGAQIAIRNSSGELLAPGEEGLIYIRAYTGDRFEYLGDQEGTERCYVGDQFTVGDIGYLNDEGYLFVMDRAENMILSGGANIYPAEVEAVLSSHPAVADCAVIGKPDDMFGETVHAVIQLTADCVSSEPQMRSEIVRFAYPRLAPSKLPRSIEFVAELPRDPNGKLMKRHLASFSRKN